MQNEKFERPQQLFRFIIKTNARAGKKATSTNLCNCARGINNVSKESRVHEQKIGIIRMWAQERVVNASEKKITSLW